MKLLRVLLSKLLPHMYCSLKTVFISFLLGLALGLAGIIVGNCIKNRKDYSLEALLVLFKRNYFLTYLLVVIAAPLGEEYFFRHILIGVLSHIMPVVTTVILSSTLFGAAHKYYPQNLIIGVFGIFITLVYLKYGFPSAVIVHGMFNFCSLCHIEIKFKQTFGSPLREVLQDYELADLLDFIEKGN